MLIKLLLFYESLILSSLLTLLSAQCPIRDLCISAPQVNIFDLSYFEDEYCGCRRILGSLTIFLDRSAPEYQSSNFTFLSHLEEVTDYLLFSNVKTSDLILPRLKIIGGRQPFIPNFGTQTYAIFFINCTIDQILFPQLTYIGDHTVGVLENRNATGDDITKELLDPNTGCNLYGVNWREVLRKNDIIYRTDVEVGMSYGDAVIVDLASDCNRTVVTSLCDQCLGDACWNASNCQILTSSFSGQGCTQCNPQSGCYDVEQGLCCDELCLGGCYGPGPDECYGCREEVNNNNSCVSACPPRFVLNIVTLMQEENPDGKFTLDKFCVPECQSNYIQFRDTCVLRCPDEYTPIVEDGVQKCEFCGSACPRECNGTDINGVSGALEAATVHLFENCTRVNGPILINSITFEGINETGLKYLESITEITGYLSIQSSDNINIFHFLRNLRVIQGTTLVQSIYSLVIAVNSFEYIDLSGLETISTGRIFIFANQNLCYLANLTAFRPESDIVLLSPPDYPNDPNCSCDYECQPELRCWGPGPTRCVSCRNFKHERTCVRNCSGIPFVFSNFETKTCSLCNSQCLSSCTDVTGFTCDACVNFKSESECVEFCLTDHYVDPANTCVSCNSLCVMGCSGPNITLSDGGCNLCNRIELDKDDNQIGCIAGDLCPSISYFERTERITDIIPERNTSDVDIIVCRPCHPLCESCNGSGIENCLRCKNFTENGVCVETCSADRYPALDECKACNQECIGCTGPTSSDCVQCPIRDLCIRAPQVNIFDLSYFEDEYCGCRRILGSLTIFLDRSAPEYQSSNFTFLSHLEEVTDYLLFSNVKTSDLILPRLKIIGGRQPFIPNFGTQTYAIFFINCTIDQILFPQLTYIGNHTVGVLENREATGADITKELLDPNTGCNLYGVNWREVLRKNDIIYRTDVEAGMSYGDAVIVDLASDCNRTVVTSLCDQCLGDACWNASNCQILTSSFSGQGCTQCNPQSGCYDVEQGLCCDELCLGGCYGPGPDECYGCREEVNNNNSCVSACPPRFVLNIVTLLQEENPDGKFTLDKFCVPECQSNYIQFKDTCVLRCPDEYTPIVEDGVQKCDLCGSACPKECNGTDINGVSDALEAATVHLFENCTRVNGPILINSITFEGINETGLKYLESITEITGYLSIQSSDNINIFHFLRNLRVIQGTTLVQSINSLVIAVNSFEYIDLSGLETISTGRIFIFANQNLCYLANLTAFRPESDIVLLSPTDYPNDPNCSCDYECQPELRCWGPGPTRCVNCRNFKHERTCVRNCSGIPFVFSNFETKTCSPCNSQCLSSCTDDTGFTCDACVNFKSGSECVEFCLTDHYVDPANTCVSCNSLCVMGCSGPNITLSDGGCNLCNRIELDKDDNQIGCIAGDLCPSISYFERTERITDIIPERNTSDVDIIVCRPCHPLCESCNGSGIENCLRCKNFIENGVCVDTCSADRYPALDECKACNQECIGCTGPTSSDCVECRNVVEEGECVATCSEGRYEDSDSNCALCHSSCGSCDGSGIYNCTGCNDPNFFTSWGMSNGTCTEGCYVGFYESQVSISECLACHTLCRTCRSYEDCTACRFARLENGSCVSRCPPDFEVDQSGICKSNTTSTLEETLDKYKYPIIGAFIAGISILICTIISFCICVVIYIRVTKKKLKVDEELENPTYGLLPSGMEGVQMNSLGTNTEYSRSRFSSQESLGEADMTQLVIADLTRIEKKEVLGKGAFGVVYRGVWLPVDGEPIFVAIKELNQDAPIEDMQELIKEAVLLAKMRHENLVRFYCLCMARQLMVVNELVEGGSLLDYLKKEGKYLTPLTRLTFMQQIASGMNYLESRRLIHRDLASRNCLVASNELVKISDFGMSRILDVGEDQYISSGGKIPVRWMPMESIFYKEYSHKSDVWSYGVTAWEILTSAKRPYGNIKPQQVIEILVSGKRLEQPVNCSNKLYVILNKCWLDKPENRISFEDLSYQLQSYLREPHLYVYRSLEGEIMSVSSESSFLGDYEEIDDEVMAYLVTTQVQIMVRAAINGKRGTLNYENLRNTQPLENNPADPFSDDYSIADASNMGPQQPIISLPADDDNYSLANDKTSEVYRNALSTEQPPASDYTLANDLMSDKKSSKGLDSNSLSVHENKWAEKDASLSNRTSNTDSEYMLTNDIYVTDKCPNGSLDSKTGRSTKVYSNPYSEVRGTSSSEKVPATEYLDSNPTLERPTPAGYLDTNPSLENIIPTEYLDSNPTLERPTPAGYLDTNPSLENIIPTEYLDSNPTLERPTPAGYLDTNPSLENVIPTEYLDSNPTLERPTPAGYLDTNPSLENIIPTEYLDSNPTLERPTPAGYLDTNPSLENVIPTEYLDSNPTLERPTPAGYLDTNPSLENVIPTEYLDSNPTLERPTPAGYLDTNPSLGRTAPTEYLNSNIVDRNTSNGVSQIKQTVYDKLDPKTMISQTKSNQSAKEPSEYENQERINSKKKKDSQSRTVQQDNNAYMEMGQNPIIFSPTLSLDNPEPVNEYEDINEDAFQVHEYSEADEIVPQNHLDTRMSQALPGIEASYNSEYSYSSQGSTSELAQKLSQSQEPHYATSLLQTVSDPNKFTLQEKNPLYGNTTKKKK